jgi:cyclopropane fatty-acyl-phospholipid synthase-like methyltransferase
VYRQAWGESFHFAIFSGAETLKEAMLATERMVAEEGGFRSGMRVLDVGCGIGGPALSIAAHSGAHVTGVNIVEQHLEIARQGARDRGLTDSTHFQFADGMDMPFADGAFDAVYVFEAGCHMPDKARFYRECARVLEPGGLFLGLDWLQKEGLTLEEEKRYSEPICKHHSVPHMITLGELRGHLLDAGLTIELLENAATRGNILRNWELLDEKTIEGIRSLAPEMMPPVLKMLTDGGIALAEAARAGAFIIGYWRARKPALKVAAS